MKKFTKKFFALLLSVFMLASLVPFAAMAEGEEDPITPPQDIQDEFSAENGYTSYSDWENERHVIEDNFCGIPGVSAVCDIFAYMKSTAVYVCDITITIGNTVNADELVISDILACIGNGIVTMPSNFIRFNIHIVDNSGNNYRYLPDSLDMSTPEWEYADFSAFGAPGINNRGKLTWNSTFAYLGFTSYTSLDSADEYFAFASVLKEKYSEQCGDINLTNSEGENDYNACNEVLARVLDDYYIEYFNKSRDADNLISTLADLTLDEVATVAMPGQMPQIVNKSKMLNDAVSQYIYWRYFYEHCLSAGDGTLVPHVPAADQYENVYHAYADKTGEPYAYMQQLFADGVNNRTTIKIGVEIDGADTQNAYQNYLFPILMPASFTLVKPADEKEDLPGLEKWIVLEAEDVLVIFDENGVPTNLPTAPEGYEIIEPILEERTNGETWFTGWKVKLDTIGAGTDVDFLLESNLGEDFAERQYEDEEGNVHGIFPENYPIHGNDDTDILWDLNDLDAFGAYTFTFHDVMAPELKLVDETTIEVKVGGQVIPKRLYWDIDEAGNITNINSVNGSHYADIYEVVNPGGTHLRQVFDENGDPVLDENNNPTYQEVTCTFEVKITGLVALFLADYFEYEQIGALPITVEYTAHADGDLTAGSYVNEAWVTANDYTTPPDDVTVITYALQVYKHDSVELEPGDENYTPLPLAGAEFYLYQESQGHPVTDGNGNVTGWEPNEDEQGNPVTPFKQGVTNAAGQLIDSATGKPIFDGLDAGTYYIVEVQAPAGYVCDHNYYPINIGGINTNPDIGAPVNENPEHPVNFTYTYDVPNVLVPHTGGTGTVVFSVIGACMLVCAGAMYVVYRRRLRAEA